MPPTVPATVANKSREFPSVGILAHYSGDLAEPMRRIYRSAIALVRALVPEPVKRLLRPLAAVLERRRASRIMRAPMVDRHRRRLYKADSRHVVFVSEVPRIREAKLASGL